MPAYKVYRDAVTGDYVTEEYAKANPDTTVSETSDRQDAAEQPPEGEDEATDEPHTSAVTLDNINPTLRPPRVI